ncbi:glycerophosphodiester phosphodiesterase family protein [Alteromonas ponticola]|uniref:Glycerophosphodiester phosphodiesterase family protein n=1 Tax=Alteromonas aquimaris TaxID=2998417 RepID=A0ABT3P2D4_9ALTE|nr:glycerophosphodiester phosphodiesterase family protein [Alteromonas aquimaris]MCW8106916.1 glycerophosphodiester phosphodiesterase family protein [Alteromonas aquimaris]
MLILAHRGASKAAPENTLSAFDLAIHQGADGIEFDTMEVDNHVIVFHDRWLERTTDGEGLVADKPIDYLRSLDAGNGEPIPFLYEVLQILPHHCICNVEIKQVTKLDTWLRHFDKAMELSGFPQDNMIVSSFNHHWLNQLSRKRPEFKLGILTAGVLENCHDLVNTMNAYSFHVDLEVVSKEYIDELKTLNAKVMVFTVDKVEDMQMLSEWGVDGIFTNVPDKARAALGKCEMYQFADAR